MPNLLELFKEPGFAAIAGGMVVITGNIISTLLSNRAKRRSEAFQFDAKNRLETLKELISFSNSLSEASLPDGDPILNRFRRVMDKQYLNKLDKEVYFLPRRMATIIDWIELCHGESQILYLTNETEKLEKKLDSGLANKAFNLKKLAMKELAKLTR